MDNNKPKDACIYFRSVSRVRGKKVDDINPQGSDRVALYLDQTNAALLRDKIDEFIENPLGVKLDLHLVKRRNRENGNVFDSAFSFVKPVEERQQVAPQRGPARFVPAGGAPAGATTFSRTAKVHEELG